MPHRSRAVTFDLDAASLVSLREALPEWEIEEICGATADSLSHDWNPGAADLLVVKPRADPAETLGLCRFLSACGVFSKDSREERAQSFAPHRNRPDPARRADAPLLVLVSSGQESLVDAALDAGADSCLVVPVNAKKVVSMLARARQGNQPGRHTLDLDQAQQEDGWRDDGGQG